MYKQLERYRLAKGRVRIAKYSRCSSDEQKKNGYTVKDQLDYIEVFSRENDLIVVDEYVDEGISATLEISKRKALAQLIEDAKAGKFDIVVFKCIDRFFRSVAEYYECQKQLQKAGVTWISIEESDLDPEDDDAAFKINIYLTMAEYEARKTSKRIKFNNKMRIKSRQVVTGGQNFLFPWKVEGEKRCRHLERDMENAPMLYDLLDHFERYQSKAKTLAYINMKYGKSMSMTTLSNLLKDTLLFGEYMGYPDYVEPYITKERFDHIQNILKNNARHFTVTEREYLFSGIIVCPYCGRKMVGQHRKGSASNPEGSYHYRCNKARVEKTCSLTGSISERKIEKQLLDNLGQYITNELIKVDSLSEAKSDKPDHTKKIEKIKNEMSRLNTMFRKGRIEEKEYDQEYYVLELELKKIDVQEKPEERNLDNLRGILETDYRSIYSELDREHKRAFWRNLIKSFALDGNKKVNPESIIFF